ncbi:hypothetical protein IMCC9480_3124 [Oxalobacteraceae bacterium IMCC9480]|nr:hypothetical protein IMCC9480_3124 [Oxalobacteraceae bacterium IMCC9480]
MSRNAFVKLVPKMAAIDDFMAHRQLQLLLFCESGLQVDAN